MTSGASTQLDTELESFRQQWLTDLHSKGNQPPSTSEPRQGDSSSVPAKHRRKVSAQAPAGKKAIYAEDDNDYLHGQAFDEAPPPSGHTLAGSSKEQPRELVSALDHFEEAMEREAQGNMGDSLKLYRQAYKLDNTVDRRYREKHFPPGHANQKKPISVAKEATEPVQPQEPEESKPLTIQDLIASFSTLAIEPTPPDVEGMPQPPCPISELPDELLSHILLDVAIADVADFARLSLVCKRLAYLVSSEQRIWHRVCIGREFGFQGLWRHWGIETEWQPLPELTELPSGDVVNTRDMQEARTWEEHRKTLSLVPSPYPSWQMQFFRRPRIRFNGCYISTVNYVRSGQQSTNQATWGGAPVLIVTYYRYLRFYRDGSCISLQTTSEPGDVVHHLTKDELARHKGDKDRGHSSTLPGAVMSLALKGRWRLANEEDESHGKTLEEREGDLYIETEGVKPRYMYRMELSLRNAGKGARNNKLVWRGFYSYNKLSADWGQFGPKNDKPFFFSRVRSYGLGA
ncbi:F-box protein-like protein [Emericellopsis cladophorae]|uniref:F-box protein-like protein n=1 Tax=Emericellopsis cladophorae TaxID=2686198 RepID=A0A9P9Y288_9HYPO|nr:F-box protein-like protein [Emericellopsis cladophorae]KAI6782263.1 F-box protein-like protein [Emericellopsis cladophorae]